MIKRFNLTETEKLILDKINYYIKNNKKVNIKLIAEECFVSTAAIIKLCKKMGYSGFSEMYYTLLSQTTKSISVDFNDFKGLTTSSTNVDISIIAELLHYYKKDRCLLCSIGYCDAAKNYLLQKLWVFGFVAIDSYHWEAIEDKTVNKGLLFVFSESGYNEDLLKTCNVAIESGYNIISFTSNNNSPIATMAHLSIEIVACKSDKDHYKANFFTAKIIVFLELLFEEYSKLYLNKK